MYTQLMIKCAFNALKLTSTIWSSPFTSNIKNQTFWKSRNLYRMMYWYFSNFILIPIQLLYCTFKLIESFTQVKKSQKNDSLNVTFQFLLLYLFVMMLMTLVFNSVMCHQMKELCAIFNEGIRIDAYFMSKTCNQHNLYSCRMYGL